jgi:hypothetical protein
MADPLSISASIVTLLQLTGTVVKYINDVGDASKDCARILVEISSVYGLLFSLKDLADRADSQDSGLATLRALAVPEGPLAQLRSDLEQLATRLRPAAGFRRAGKALAWPFTKGEIRDALSNVERQKTLFILALQGDHA